jgi:hypothetical protein
MKETNIKPSSPPTNTPAPSNSRWYEEWHSTQHHAITHWVILLVIIAVSFFLLRGQIKSWVDSLNQTGVTVTVVKSNAQLSLDPKTQTVKVGDTFAVNVTLDTGSKPVDGVDLYSLHYDPSILQVIDDSTAKGVQITPGTVLPVTAANMVDEKSGTIKYSGVANGGSNFSGKGVLATIHFKAIATGAAFLKFDFTQGSTVDSNAAYRGKDQLTSVVDAIYNVTAK